MTKMEKKSIVAAVVAGILIVGVIIAVLVYDGFVNTVILEVNGVKYDKSDFESYLKVYQYEKGKEAVDIDEEFDTYQIYKLYSQYVDMYQLKLDEENKIAELTDSEKEKLEKEYALSESEYKRVKTEIALVDQLWRSLGDYYKIPDEIYEAYKAEKVEHAMEHGLSEDQVFKTYQYRVMQVPVPDAPETSGDTISGDKENSGDTNTSGNLLSGEQNSGNSFSGDNGSGETLSKEEVAKKQRQAETKAKAEEALAKVKAGEKFEEVAKEYGTMRIVFSASGYQVVNGGIETVSGLYMDDYVYDEDILDALRTLKAGEYSKIYESENSYTFVYMEKIEDGIDKDSENTFKREIANELIQTSAVIVRDKIILKSIDIEKLIPALTKVSGDNQTPALSGESQGTSGDAQGTSGEVVSGNNSGDNQEENNVNNQSGETNENNNGMNE